MNEDARIRQAVVMPPPSEIDAALVHAGCLRKFVRVTSNIVAQCMLQGEGMAACIERWKKLRPGWFYA